MFIRVDLPAPFSPRRAWISPGRTSRSMWSLARTPGNRLVMPRISRAGGVTVAAGSVAAASVTVVNTPGCCERAGSEDTARSGRGARSESSPLVLFRCVAGSERGLLAGLEGAGLHIRDGLVQLRLDVRRDQGLGVVEGGQTDVVGRQVEDELAAHVRLAGDPHDRIGNVLLELLLSADD